MDGYVEVKHMFYSTNHKVDRDFAIRDVLDVKRITWKEFSKRIY